jgi:hypothetical protein
MNAAGMPTATIVDTGVIEIDTSAGDVTVSSALFDDIPPSVAWMFTGPPIFTPVARPDGLSVAIVVSEEVHVTEFVMFCMKPPL